MELEDLQTRVQSRMAKGVDELRDRTADKLGADGRSVFRELGKLARRIDDARSATESRIDATETVLSDRIDALAAADRRTTWPRRMFWLMFGATAGMAAGYLGDPDRGSDRRTQMSQQLTARGRDLSDDMRKRAKVATDRAKGQAIEQAKSRRSEEPTADANLIEQRIKSQVFGGRDDTNDVVIRVDAPGTVALKGTVPTPASERELLAAVSEVDGVVDVRSELHVSQS